MANSRNLISRYVSESRKDHRRIARACNIARWWELNSARLEGDYISSRTLRRQIPNQFKNPNLDVTGDFKAHGDAIHELGLSWVQKGKDRMIDVSIINGHRCRRYLLSQGRKVGALIMSEKQLVAVQQLNNSQKTDLVIIDALERACGEKTDAFKKLNGAQAFVVNLCKNYRRWIKAGERALSDPQRRWALDLIDKS